MNQNLRSACLGLAALGLLVSACGEKGRNHPAGSYWTSPAAQGTSSASTLGQRLLLQDLPSPQVDVQTPPAGAFVPRSQAPGGLIEVRGQATEPTSGMRRVTVDGQEAPLDAQGRFAISVRLREGLHTIPIVAEAQNGASTLAHRSVLYGDFLDLKTPVPQAAGVRINPSFLPGLGRVLESVIRSTDFDRLLRAQNPLYKDAGTQGGKFQFEVRARNPSYAQVEVRLNLAPDGLDCAVTLHGFKILVDLQGVVAGIAIQEQGELTMDRFGAALRLELRLDAQGRVLANVRQPLADIVNLRLNLVNPGFVLSLFQSSAETIIRDKLSQMLSGMMQRDLPPLVQDYFDREIYRQPRTIDGVTFTMEAFPRILNLDAAGLSLGADLNISAPPLSARSTAPGSYFTPSPPAPLFTPKDAAVIISDDIINRSLHVAWAAGLLRGEFKVGAKIPSSPAAAASGLSLDAATLIQFLPNLSRILQPHDTMVIKVDGRLPPVIRLGGSPEVLEIQVGELVLDLYVEQAGGPPKLLVSLATHFRIGAQVTLQQHRVHIDLSQNMDLHANILSEPVLELDDQGAENLMRMTMRPFLPYLTRVVQDLALPSIGSAQLLDVSAEATGPARDFLILHGRIR